MSVPPTNYNANNSYTGSLASHNICTEAKLNKAPKLFLYTAH